MQSIDPPPQPGNPGGDSRKLIEDIHGYLRVVRRGWRLIVVCVLVAASAAVFKIARSKTVYTSSARLLVIQQGGGPLSVAGGNDPFPNIQGPNDSLATHLMIIRSPVVVERAVALSGLKTVSVPTVIGGLSVKLPDASARVVEVGYRADSPDEATKVIDGVIKSYDRFLKENYQKNTSDVIALIVRARDDLNNELKSLEQQYLEYRQKNPAYSADERGRSFIARRLDQWDQAMNQALSRAIQLRSQLDLGKRLAGEGVDQEVITNAINQLGGLGGVSQGNWVSPPINVAPTDGPSPSALGTALADIEFQRKAAEQILTHLRREQASPSHHTPVTESEIARAFYADPAVAAVVAKLRGQKDKLNTNARLVRSSSDPSVAGLRKSVKSLEDDLRRLWQKRRPVLTANLSREANVEIAAEVRRAEAELVALKAKEAATRDRLAQESAGELKRLRAEFDQLVALHGPGHARARQLGEQIARLENGKGRDPSTRAGVAKASALVQSLTRSLESIEDVRRELQRKFEEDMAASKKTEIVQLEETNLRSNLERQRTLFNSVVDQLKHAQLVSDFGSVSAQTINPPSVAAERPQAVPILAAALVAGCVVGAGCAFVFDLLEGRVRSLAELRKLVDLPMIGMIPHLPFELSGNSGPLGLLSHTNPRSAMAESYKSARTNLEFLRRDRRMQLLLVSSAHAGDGKSTTASNLAIALANTGRRVLLIDADLRRPSLHTTYGVPRDRGLSNALEGRESLAQLAQPTHVRNLDLLTTGPDVPNPAELLASARLGELLEEVRTSYDTVIIDSSPLLAVTDPSIISAVVDGMILVVRITSSRRHDVEQTSELLDAQGVPVIGFIVNDVTRDQVGYRYGSQGYGYEYGYGYGHVQPDANARTGGPHGAVGMPQNGDHGRTSQGATTPHAKAARD